MDLPPWNDDIAAFRIRRGRDTRGYVFGWEFRAPVIEMPLYMPWLRSKVEEGGGTFRHGFIEDLSDLVETL